MREKDIIQKIKNGETELIEHIVSTYYTEIYSYLCRKLGSEIEAQDVTQEVFIKFFTNLHTYQERGKLKNYLFKLATNASNDVFRKNKPMHSLDVVEELQDSNPTPWEVTEQKEDQKRVKAALQTLSGQQREVIILRFYHELSFLDIARITESNLSTVKTRYRRGMMELKKILEVEYEE
ncbi:MAG: RNA polymerase sigma factor [Agathobacter sp.]|nr:RNA polymerase sigma factor [Agathobacter sp.]